MSHDPVARGRMLANLFQAVAPRLFDDLVESGVLAGAPDDHARGRREWDAFALYACVRGLVAAGGFNRETAAAIDAMHERVLERWAAEPDAHEPFDARRARISERYSEYGAIGQAGGAAGAATVGQRLGEAAARHLAPAAPTAALATLAGALHETLVEGAAEAVRRLEAEA